MRPRHSAFSQAQRPTWYLVTFAALAVGWSWWAYVRLSVASMWPRAVWPAAGLLFGTMLVVWLGRPGVTTAALLGSSILLTHLGLLFRFRISTPESWPNTRTDWAYPLGLLCMLTTWLSFRGNRHRVLRHLRIPAHILSLAVLATVWAVGRRFRGGMFMAGHVNPTEVVKILLPLSVAAWMSLHEREWRTLRLPDLVLRLAPGTLWWMGLPLLLLAGLRDFGMALQVATVWVLMIALATERAWHAVLGMGLLLIVAIPLFHLLPHAAVRWQIWRDPFSDEVGGAWQLLQGLAALHQGGFWGRGLGGGSPHLVPIAASDFTYAMIAEELGYLGCGLLLGLFFAFFSAGLDGVGFSRDGFTRLLAGGLTVMLAAQTLLHIGGVTATLPLTGIPLPFLSHGGSNLVVSLTAAGLLAAITDRSRAGASTRPMKQRRRRR